MKRFAGYFVFALAGCFAAQTAQAQFVPMSRCRAALSCSIPFSIQYRPDPLIAGRYGGPGNGGFVVSVPLGRPFAPRIETSRERDLGAALEADIQRSARPGKPEEGNALTKRELERPRVQPPPPGKTSDPAPDH
jgi:hypothetical protein